jgi:hypothetical protein
MQEEYLWSGSLSYSYFENLIGSAEHKVSRSCPRATESQSFITYNYSVGNRRCGIYTQLVFALLLVFLIEVFHMYFCVYEVSLIKSPQHMIL